MGGATGILHNHHRFHNGLWGVWGRLVGLPHARIVVYRLYSFYTGSQPGSAYISRSVTGRQTI